MPNVFGNYNETFFSQEALIQLEKVMGLAGRVHRGYNANPQTKGDTIQIRRPSTFVAQAAPSVAQDLDTESVSIQLTEWDEVKFKLTDKDLSLTSDQIISDHIRPAAVALADKIDQKGALLYRKVPWYSTLTGTPVLGDIGKLRKIMFDNKVPLRDQANLNYMVDGTSELAYLNALAAAGMQPNQQDGSLREGSMGRLFGFDTWANQNTPSHTSGVAADAVGALGANVAKGATTISFDGVSNGATFKAGDSFAITGDPQRYVFAADATADGAGVVAAATIYPPLKQASLENAVITIFLGGVDKPQTLAFHRNFAALAMAPLSTLGGQLGARITTVSDPVTNLSLRSRIFYDGDASTVFVALDVLYGWQILDPNLAVRGNAA
jgi:hypothetical protein